MATGTASGRTSSWIAVWVICVGFAIGGLGLVLEPTWWMFWVGVAITVVGTVMALVVGIMEDYTTEAH